MARDGQVKCPGCGSTEFSFVEDFAGYIVRPVQVSGDGTCVVDYDPEKAVLKSDESRTNYDQYLRCGGCGTMYVVDQEEENLPPAIEEDGTWMKAGTDVKPV